MQFYDRADFLEFFDTETIEDREAGYYKYDLKSSDDITLTISMNIYEGWVYFKLSSSSNMNLVDFDLDHIVRIVCDRSKSRTIRFLFYQLNKQFPIILVYIKPHISLDLDIDQKGEGFIDEHLYYRSPNK